MVSALSKRLFVIGLILLAGGLALASPAAAQDDDGRPELPDEQIYGTEHFLIHYTLTGEHATIPDDADGDGVPDFVALVGETLEYAWDQEVNVFGWTAPPLDEGEGGDTRLDVYLENILVDDYAGYILDSAVIGDNPNSTELERRAAYGFMGLDNDYAEVEEIFGAGTSGEVIMQTTVAHEFNHLIQIGHDVADQHAWLYESTASWIEDEVYDDVNDNVYYIYDLFDDPGRCFVSEENWYANWLFIRLISERYGHETVRSIWEHNRTMDGFDAIDAALAPFGSSLETEAADYVIANLLLAYEEGDTYPTLTIETTLDDNSYTPSNGVQSFGAHYIELSGGGVVDVVLADTLGLLSLRVVGIGGDSADVYTGDDALTVDLSAYDFAYAVIQNTERVTPEQNCNFADYTLTVSPSSGVPGAVAETWSAGNSQPLETTVIGDEDESTMPQLPASIDLPFLDDDNAAAPTDLEVGFVYVVPATAPPGYAFDYAYVLTADDFGEVADYYIPGGGESANLDYLNDAGDWLGITQSPSPYVTLDEWMDGIGYFDSPGSIETMQGVEVLIEDLSDEEGPWYSATMIVNGLFIVIDADGSVDDLRAMAEIMAQSAQGGVIPDAAPTEEFEAEVEEPAAEEPVADEPTAGFDEDMASFLAGAGLLLVCGGGLCLLLAGAVVAGVMFLRRR